MGDILSNTDDYGDCLGWNGPSIVELLTGLSIYSMVFVEGYRYALSAYSDTDPLYSPDLMLYFSDKNDAMRYKLSM